MLTISTFLFVTSSVLTSVWWACKDEGKTASPNASEIVNA